MNSQDSAKKLPFNDTSIQIKTDTVKIRSNNCISIFPNVGPATGVNFPLHNGKLFYKALLLANVRHGQITHHGWTVSL